MKDIDNYTMSEVDDNEQWLSDGICGKCRRSDYCKKSCKANDERTKHLVFRELDKHTGGLLSYMKVALWNYI